jgi:FeoA domain.
MTPLALAPVNVGLRVIKIFAGDKVKKHLENLGVTIDSPITVISHCNGNSVCAVKDCRLALDNDISAKIHVA